MIKLKDMMAMGRIATCSIENPVNGGLAVIVGDENEIPQIVDGIVNMVRSKGIAMNVLCPDFIIPKDKPSHGFSADFVGRNAVVNIYDFLSKDNKCVLRLWPTENPLKNFIIFHNEVHKNNRPTKDVIVPNAIVHPTAIIGNPTPLVLTDTVGSVKMKPVGNVWVESNATICAMAIVSKAYFPSDSTIIKSGSTILENAYVGPYCMVGNGSLIEQGVILGAGVSVGRGVKIGMGAKICPNVKIGNGVEVIPGDVIFSDIVE